jgi:hypothetical protein
LEDSVDRGENEVLRLANFAAGKRCKSLQIPAQGSALQITQGQFAE